MTHTVWNAVDVNDQIPKKCINAPYNFLALEIDIVPL